MAAIHLLSVVCTNKNIRYQDLNSISIHGVIAIHKNLSDFKSNFTNVFFWNRKPLRQFDSPKPGHVWFKVQQKRKKKHIIFLTQGRAESGCVPKIKYVRDGFSFSLSLSVCERSYWWTNLRAAVCHCQRTLHPWHHRRVWQVLQHTGVCPGEHNVKSNQGKYISCWTDTCFNRWSVEIKTAASFTPSSGALHTVKLQNYKSVQAVFGLMFP